MVQLEARSKVSLVVVTTMMGSAVEKMQVCKSGHQLQLHSTLYDRNVAVPSDPRYCGLLALQWIVQVRSKVEGQGVL